VKIRATGWRRKQGRAWVKADTRQKAADHHENQKQTRAIATHSYESFTSVDMKDLDSNQLPSARGLGGQAVPIQELLGRAEALPRARARSA
jgi:hypothetical protein